MVVRSGAAFDATRLDNPIVDVSSSSDAAEDADAAEVVISEEQMRINEDNQTARLVVAPDATYPTDETLTAPKPFEPGSDPERSGATWAWAAPAGIALGVLAASLLSWRIGRNIFSRQSPTATSDIDRISEANDTQSDDRI
jgi:hypothetical protein